MNGTLTIVDDVPHAFAEAVVRAFQERPGELFSIALSGGSTARACYEALAERAGDRIDWTKVDFYWGDERCVPPDSPDSNERLAREALLEKIGTANAVYPMRCADGADAYQLRLGELKQFDLVHLGFGPDGHTASLFPDSPALNADPGRYVVMNEDPNGRNKLPRMTLTYAGIARSRKILFTVSGAEKADAFKQLQDGVDLPAARVQGPDIEWLVDAEAAGNS